MKLVSNHPNATAGLAGGSLGGAAVVYLLGLAGFDVAPETAAAIAGVVASAVLFVGRNGLKGAIDFVWKGKEDPPPAPPTA